MLFLEIVDTLAVLFLVGRAVYKDLVFKHSTPVETPAVMEAGEPFPSPQVSPSPSPSGRTDLAQVVTYPELEHRGWVEIGTAAFEAAWKAKGLAVKPHGKPVDPGEQD